MTILDFNAVAQIIDGGRQAELQKLVQQLAREGGYPSPKYVHDGNSKQFYTFAGNAMYEKKFNVRAVFNCGAIPVMKWQSHADIKQGDFVLNDNGKAGPMLHLVVGAETHRDGENNVSTGYSVAFKVSEVAGYAGGVGAGGRERPAKNQMEFT